MEREIHLRLPGRVSRRLYEVARSRNWSINTTIVDAISRYLREDGDYNVRTN